MYSCFQAGYGVFGCKQNVQNVQKCTDLYVCFPVGYELFENNIFSAYILASSYCVSVETIKYVRYFSRCWVLVECQWRHQKSGALIVTGTQVYQIETESAPCTHPSKEDLSDASYHFPSGAFSGSRLFG